MEAFEARFEDGFHGAHVSRGLLGGDGQHEDAIAGEEFLGARAASEQEADEGHDVHQEQEAEVKGCG